MCPAIHIGSLEESEAYAAMSVASSVASSVQRGTTHIMVAARLWKLERILKSFSDSLYHPKQIDNTVPTVEQIDLAIKVLHALYGVLDRLLTRACRAGYANNSITSTQLTSIRRMADDLFDLAEAIEFSQDKEVLDSFEKARLDYVNGNTVPFDSLS
jgi:hypothetical protein